ncbi:MAG TPA: hypothetical protein VFS17_07590 [Methylophilaceae bacterium]|nr:hypothetical protein [Methylophilaceae bacterium]
MARSTDTREELLLLYQITVADLSYFKTQQWSVTNYALLIFTALVGVAQLLKPLSSNEHWFLSAVAVAGMAFALVILSKLQKSISVRQSRLAATRDNFSDSFKQAWAAEVKGHEYIHSIFFLSATVIIGGILAIWLVGFRI